MLELTSIIGVMLGIMADKDALLIEFNKERETFENKILNALSAYKDASSTVDKRENLPKNYNVSKSTSIDNTSNSLWSLSQAPQ